MAVAATTPVLTQVDARCEAALELIDEHYPLLLVRWSGQLQAQHVLRMIRFFDANTELARSGGARLVNICDASDAALPSSLVRDMLVDWLSDHPRGRPRGGRTTALRSFVVVRDPLIRGVVASLKWATGLNDGIRVVSTLDQAVAGARETLERAGCPIPDILRPA